MQSILSVSIKSDEQVNKLNHFSSRYRKAIDFIDIPRKSIPHEKLESIAKKSCYQRKKGSLHNSCRIVEDLQSIDNNNSLTFNVLSVDSKQFELKPKINAGKFDPNK